MLIECRFQSFHISRINDRNLHFEDKSQENRNSGTRKTILNIHQEHNSDANWAPIIQLSQGANLKKFRYRPFFLTQLLTGLRSTDVHTRIYPCTQTQVIFIKYYLLYKYILINAALIILYIKIELKEHTMQLVAACASKLEVPSLTLAGGRCWYNRGF